jgi:aconitate hydratase
VKGPNIAALPELRSPRDDLTLPVLLAVGDDVSTDEILPAGARVLPFRSNIEAIRRFCFEAVDPTYAERALRTQQEGSRHGEHAIVAGRNYGQGSSREHAALAPASLGLRVVLAKTFARIHMQNLANFGVLPLQREPRDEIRQGDRLRIHEFVARLSRGEPPLVENATSGHEVRVRCALSRRQIEMVLAGGVFRWIRRPHRSAA